MAQQLERAYRPYLLGALTALVLTAGWSWLGGTPAVAQVPDSGAQRNAMIVELQKSNEKLDAILKVLMEIRDRQAGVASGPAGPSRP